jgi:multiple sugar transport system permease protein
MGQQRLFRGVTPYLFVAPAVGILIFTCLYPVIKGFELSFYDWSLGTPISSRKFVGWENFAWACRTPRCSTPSR